MLNVSELYNVTFNIMIFGSDSSIELLDDMCTEPQLVMYIAPKGNGGGNIFDFSVISWLLNFKDDAAEMYIRGIKILI